MEKFVKQLLLIWHDLTRFFVLADFESDGWNTLHSHVIKLFAAALDYEFMYGICLAMDAICRGLQRFASFPERCWCHEYLLLHGEGRPIQYADRLREWKRESAKCIWRGRRWVELVAGKLMENLWNLRGASTAALREHLARCSEAERGALIGFMEPILEAVYTEILDRHQYI